MKKALVITMFVAIGSLSLSAETHVQLIGDSNFRDDELRRMLGDRLVQVVASPPKPSLADDAAFMLRELLVQAGYPEAKVDWKITGAAEITLAVQTGQNMVLGNVHVVGAKGLDELRLVNLLKKPAMKSQTLIRQQVPYRASDVEAGIALVQQELWAQGYWAAKVELEKTEPHPEVGKVDLQVSVQPGGLFTIGAAEVIGDSGEVVVKVSSIAAQHQKKVATTANLNALRQEVENTIKSAGYPEAEIRMLKGTRESIFAPIFTIALGRRVKLHEVYAQGYEKTQAHRIARRFRKMKGTWYDATVFNKRVGELMSTGAFTGVRMEQKPYGEDQIDVVLTLEEGKAKEFSVALGYGTYQGAIMQMGYADRNLFGDLLGFSVGVEAGSRQFLGELKLTDPWLFGTDVLSTARFYSLTYRYDGYGVFDVGMDDKFVLKLGKHYAIECLGGISMEECNADGLPESELGEMSYLHPMVKVTQTLDFRNNPVLPTQGWHLQHVMQAGTVVGNLDNDYVMMGIAGGWYHDLRPNLALAIGGKGMLMDSTGDLMDLPINLRLFNGGARSVRSFPERELGPMVNGNPTGGLSAWSANVELIQSVSNSLKCVAFFDAGATSANAGDLNTAEIDMAVGLGVRFNLPIGPVRLEYGYNLTKDPGEPTGALHLAIGLTF